MNGLFIVGLLILIGGVCGIVFVTAPSILNIGDVANTGASGEEITNSQIAGAVLSGVLLWLTTGLFIVAILFGFIITIAGLG